MRIKRDDGGGSTDGRCATGRTVARELTAVSWEGAAASRRQQPLLLSRVAGDKKKKSPLYRSVRTRTVTRNIPRGTSSDRRAGVLHCVHAFTAMTARPLPRVENKLNDYLFDKYIILNNNIRVDIFMHFRNSYFVSCDIFALESARLLYDPFHATQISYYRRASFMVV